MHPSPHSHLNLKSLHTELERKFFTVRTVEAARREHEFRRGAGFRNVTFTVGGIEWQP